MDKHPRQPNDLVFNDIVRAAQVTWTWGNYSEDYIQNQMEFIQCLQDQNYKDNWHSIIGRMDNRNQMIFWHHIEFQETCDFLKKMRIHYKIFVPRDKK